MKFYTYKTTPPYKPIRKNICFLKITLELLNYAALTLGKGSQEHLGIIVETGEDKIITK